MTKTLSFLYKRFFYINDESYSKDFDKQILKCFICNSRDYKWEMQPIREKGIHLGMRAFHYWGK